MLVLTRRTNESLLLELPDGQVIQVTVTDVHGNQAKIGIEAPAEIGIVREDLVSFQESA